jgi:hypothetical protein
MRSPVERKTSYETLKSQSQFLPKVRMGFGEWRVREASGE